MTGVALTIALHLRVARARLTFAAPAGIDLAGVDRQPTRTS